MTMIQRLLLVFRVVGGTAAHSFLAFTQFWNIPPLGEIELSDNPRRRANRGI